VELGSGPGRRWRRAQQATLTAGVLVALTGCGAPALYFQSPTDELKMAQDRAFLSALTDRVNAISHCLDVQARECVVNDLKQQKDAQ
jgi:hypothetical protein